MTLIEALAVLRPLSAMHQYKPSSSLVIFFNVKEDDGPKFLASLPDLVHVTLGVGMPVVWQLMITSSPSVDVQVEFFEMLTIVGRSVKIYVILKSPENIIDLQMHTESLKHRIEESLQSVYQKSWHNSRIN